MTAISRDRIVSFIRSDWCNLRSAIKASIPPAVLICLIESDRWLGHFQTTSYLAPVIAVGAPRSQSLSTSNDQLTIPLYQACCLPTLPRAKMVWLHGQIGFAFVLAYAYSLLAGWCGLQARRHTTASVTPVTSPYNGSAEAVVAIFFVVFFWGVFALKSANPSWQVPCVLAGLYMAAVLPPIATFAAMDEILHVTSVAVEACMIGLAFACVVGLLLFPQTCRSSLLDNIESCMKQLKAMAKPHTELMESLVVLDLEKAVETQQDHLVERLKASLQAFLAGANQARTTLILAKQELAYSRFGSKEMEDLCSSISRLVPLLSGIVSTADMLQTARKNDHPETPDKSRMEATLGRGDKECLSTNHERSDWQSVLFAMQQQSLCLSVSILGLADHALKQFEISRHDRVTGANPGEHQNAEKPKPTSKLESFTANSTHPLLGRRLGGESWFQDMKPADRHLRSVHYFIALSEQKVLRLAASEVNVFVESLDLIDKQPKRIAMPDYLSVKDYLWSLVDPNHALFGSARPTAGFAKVMQVFRSKHAGFALRGACAMMSVAIVAFLPSSGSFYAAQRFLWALYAILLSLNQTAGSSTQSLCFRFAGTLASMVASYIIWYVPDRRTPGILVLLWLWFAILAYLYARFPRLQGSIFVAFIAAIVMVGNELQVDQLGAEAVRAIGQAVYEPYVLFPYRMAIVTLGIVVAYSWTLFPFPLTEHRELRINVSSAISSLAKLHLAVREILRVRFFREGGMSSNGPSSEEASRAAFRRHLSDFQRFSSASQSLIKFLDWEVALGKPFPKAIATQIMALTNQIANHISLIEALSASTSLLDSSRRPTISDQDESMLYRHLYPKGITGRLIDLSNALSEGHALAPDMEDVTIPDIEFFLDLQCPSNEVFATAAFIHAANWYMIQDLSALTRLVASVAGTLEFRVDSV